MGTHEQAFERLLRIAQHCVQRLPGTEWAVQTGSAHVEFSDAKACAAYFPHDELARWNMWSDAVMTHASPGAVFDALNARSQPIIVPRRQSLREHVNDHQVGFAHRLEALGLAWIVSDEVEAAAAVGRVACEDQEMRFSRLDEIAAASRERTEQFVLAFDEAINSIAARRPMAIGLGR